MKRPQWLAPDKYVVDTKISYVIVVTASSCPFRVMLGDVSQEILFVTCARARAHGESRPKD
jgi:hypothetical protein